MIKKWCISAFAVLTLAIAVRAQRGYGGPARMWWDGGLDTIFAREDEFENATGFLAVLNVTPVIRTKGHPFFEPLGTNGRACVTCHQPANSMSVAAATVRERWTATEGKDPLFAAVDGSNCPDLPQADAKSHSLLLDRGLFRIPISWPPKNVEPDFQIEVVRDPTGCNLSAKYGFKSTNTISVFRRPRITANLRYVVSGEAGQVFMADGREPTLRSQAISAILGHQEASAQPADKQLLQIVDFETQIYAAQVADKRGGLLTDPDSPLLLGPENLLEGRFGSLDGGAATAEKVFERWRDSESVPREFIQRDFRDAAGRGASIFYGKSFGAPGGVMRTCASCHASGTERWINIGSTEQEEDKALPLFKITCSTGRVVYVNDPGRALISGKCADAGAIVLQQFRGLSARAPYFANGSAATLSDVVEFYDKRFKIGLSSQEKNDLALFLSLL
jgi:hypothetical protein